jgi:AraC family transcriptional regulator
MSTKLSSTPSLLTSSHQANWSGISLKHYLYPAYETPEHVLEDHHICIYLGNPLTYEQIIRGKLRSQTCIYGDMVIYPAGSTQKLSWDREAEIIQLDIKPEFVTQASSLDKIELIPQFGFRDSLLQQLALSLSAELRHGVRENRLYTDSLFNTLCLHLMRHYSTSTTTVDQSNDGLPSFLLRRLKEYIQENLSQNLTLADMAQMLGLSRSHLTKLFKQSQGISLYQYIIHCRIARAKQLLKHKRLAIAEIATQVGFADQSHLTHHFKRHVGLTPKIFRQL